jgi:hypothetical protein
MRDLASILTNLRSRYNPDNDLLVEGRMYSELSGEEKATAKYIKAAMSEVDQRYTQITLDAGEAVKRQLNAKQTGISYEYQGSVMTRTHIRGVSDIDLLTLTNKFEDTELTKVIDILENYNLKSQYSYTSQQRLQQFREDFSRYTGDSDAELMALRLNNESILRTVYSQCDISNAKSIKIHHQHYNRDIDVVTANWLVTVGSIINYNDKTYKGVKIFDKEKRTTLPADYPFLSIKRINDRSTHTGGRLKKMIRFLKNVVADSDKTIDLHSFEINAICYACPPQEYMEMYYLDLAYYIWHWMYNLHQDKARLDALKSVDGSEYVFFNKPERVAALKLLEDEVWSLYNSLNRA